ncbi:MAG: hypothetical protein PHI97_18995 [Desulfobulbus sp.]|nr:hypothetical protein [Desulfobulbus sp.]
MKIAVDFDGTCVDHQYPEIGVDVPLAVATMQDLIKAGHNIILYTMRSDVHLTDAINWFPKRGIALHGVQVDPEQNTWTTSPKCYADIYIDDRNFGCPLIIVKGFTRKCVNWKAVREILLSGANQTAPPLSHRPALGLRLLRWIRNTP